MQNDESIDNGLGPQDLALVYDPKMNQWTELPRLSSPRGSVAVAAVDERWNIWRRCIIEC